MHLPINATMQTVILQLCRSSKIVGREKAVAAMVIKISEEDIKTLEELYQPHRILGHS
jgi:hypothetical protein